MNLVNMLVILMASPTYSPDVPMTSLTYKHTQVHLHQIFLSNYFNGLVLFTNLHFSSTN